MYHFELLEESAIPELPEVTSYSDIEALLKMANINEERQDFMEDAAREIGRGFREGATDDVDSILGAVAVAHLREIASIESVAARNGKLACLNRIREFSWGGI